MQIQKQTKLGFSSSSPASKGRLTGEVKIFAFRTDLLKLIRGSNPRGGTYEDPSRTTYFSWRAVHLDASVWTPGKSGWIAHKQKVIGRNARFNWAGWWQKVRTYVSVKDACKLSGYKEQYLRRLLRQRKLSRRTIGQVWLIEVSSLQSYLLLANQFQDKRFGPRKKVKHRGNFS